MHITQKTIDDLTSYTRKIISGRTDIIADDVVNSALLDALEKDKDIDYVRQAIKTLVFNEKQGANKPDLYKGYSVNETTKVCKHCHEELPIASFYILRYRKINKEIIQHICKRCRAEYYKKRRQTDDSYRMKINARSSEFQKKKLMIKKIKSKGYLKAAHSILDKMRIKSVKT